MNDTIEQRDRAVDLLRAELHRLVRESQKTQRDIEKENGYARGYLSQVLNGHMSITVRHVFAILLSLEIPPGRFFARLFPDLEDAAFEGPAFAFEEPALVKYGPGEPSGTLSELRQKLAVYDSALKELQEKGLLSGGGE